MGKGTVSLKVAADWLGLDIQTVRILIRNGVDWGQAIRGRGDSFVYIVYEKKFSELTGYQPPRNPQEMDGTKQFCEILSETIEKLQSLQTEKSDDLFLYQDCQKMIDALDMEIDLKRR